LCVIPSRAKSAVFLFLWAAASNANDAVVHMQNTNIPNMFSSAGWEEGEHTQQAFASHGHLPVMMTHLHVQQEDLDSELESGDAASANTKSKLKVPRQQSNSLRPPSGFTFCTCVSVCECVRALARRRNEH
jgi:hypothetical protein